MPDKKSAKLNKYILHVDGDAFFVACEAAARPDLRGKALVVGEERGIVTALTYEAKAMGVKRGMPIFKLKHEFPSVIILPTHFELYKMYSQKLGNILRRYCIVVEVYSIDECFAVIESSSWIEAEKLIRKIKNVTQESLGITFSFGLARTKVLAKVASKAQKPDGLTIIEPQMETVYLAKTPIGKVWGIGYRTAPKLFAKRIMTALDFRNLTQDYLEQFYSEPFQALWHELCGRPVMSIGNDSRAAKSIQSTRTFNPNTKDPSTIFSELSKNVEVAFMRARDEKLVTNLIYIFIKNTDYKYYSTEVSIPFYTDNPVDAIELIEMALLRLLNNKRGTMYRSTGVTLVNLRTKESCNPDLFGVQNKVWRRGELTQTIDHLRSNFGTNTIYLGSSMKAILKRDKLKELKPYDPYVNNLPVPYLGEVA